MTWSSAFVAISCLPNFLVCRTFLFAELSCLPNFLVCRTFLLVKVSCLSNFFVCRTFLFFLKFFLNWVVSVNEFFTTFGTIHSLTRSVGGG